MEIVDVKDTIVKWICSCDRIEQVEGLEKSAPDIIDTLFDKKESALVIAMAKATLITVMETQKQLLNQKP